jgi:hypothetical protein
MRTPVGLYEIFNSWKDEGKLNQNESLKLLREGTFSDDLKFSYATIRSKNKLIENYIGLNLFCLRILPDELVRSIFDCLLEDMRAYALREETLGDV